MAGKLKTTSQDQAAENASELTLFHMITEGDIKAKIDCQQQMISFIDTNSVSGNGQDAAKEAEYLDVIEELEAQN